MSKIVLLAGGTGFVGTRLREMLLEKGYAVRLLSRRPRGDNEFAWDPAAGTLDESALQGVHAVINLAGAGIAEGRWTPGRRRAILDSRTQSAALLCRAFERGSRPEVYLSTSAVGFYGNSGEQIMREADAPVGGGFMVEVCRAWEHAADDIAALGIRTLKIRVGIVLDRSGGALREMARPMRFGLGAYFGDGRAWYAWIHRDDLCRVFIFFLENQQFAGVFNAVAPEPARNRDLIKAVVRARHRPAILAPAPAFALRAIFGEMADTILFSNRVSAEKLLATGFSFQFPTLEGALADIFQ